jgi:hypothetical protein
MALLDLHVEQMVLSPPDLSITTLLAETYLELFQISRIGFCGILPTARFGFAAYIRKQATKNSDPRITLKHTQRTDKTAK